MVSPPRGAVVASVAGVLVAGRSPKARSSSRPSSSAVTSPATPTVRLSLARRVDDERAQVGGLEPGDALQRAAHRSAVGLPGERGLEPGQARQIVGVLGAAPQARLDLMADALDRLGVEARLDQRQAQQLEGAAAMLAQRLELAGEAVALGIERQADRQVLELGAERLAVERAGALVEQARDHVGQALLAARVERRAAGEVDRHRQERNRRLADQIGLDAARADHPLDLGRGAGRRARREHAQCQGAAQHDLPAPLNHCHPARPTLLGC